MINTSVFQDKKAAYFTLGCKLNFSETSTFGKMLADLGVHVAEEGEVADICLVNTCSVTEVADHKCRQAIHRLVRNNPGGSSTPATQSTDAAPKCISERTSYHGI